MPPGNDEENGGGDGEVWDNEWDDSESTTGEGHQQLQPVLLHDQDEEEMEEEIRANLSSKVTSSLHSYRVAGFALIITLISFTINTVCGVLGLDG
jgi:hypothetical protein